MRRLAWMLLLAGLVSIASAARAPKDKQDMMNGLDPLWSKASADFAKGAGLKAGEYTIADSPVAGSGMKIFTINDPGRSRWTPQSLARAMQAAEFDPKLGLVEVTGALKGTAADFDALLKELNTRYGQYSLHTSAGGTHTYGWVFPKATLSVSSNQGAPVLFRIQANP